MSAELPLRLFVYGTLKSGQPAYERLRDHVVHIDPAAIQGKLFDLPAGYPMLVVPKEIVLTHGTEDYAADLELQESMVRAWAVAPTAGVAARIAWGEFLYLKNGAALLAELDAFEGFEPRGDCLYHRVLALLSAPRTLAWVYVAPAGRLPPGAVAVQGEVWPAEAGRPR